MIESDIYIIVVPTPFRANKEADTSIVENAFENIIPMLKEGDMVIVESTVPIGTVDRLSNKLFLIRPALKGKIFVAYCPERVLPGNIIYELVNNDRIVGGIDDDSSNCASSFYKSFIKGNVFETNAKTAEMCKLVENASRDCQIAFANEISLIAYQEGINDRELIDLANKHPRVNILNPGPGVGGHCIAVDPWFLASKYEQAKLISMAREVNDNKPQWCVDLILEKVREFRKTKKQEPKVAIMGLAFKANIDDLRESPALQIAEMLLKENILINVSEPNISKHQKFDLKSPIKSYNDSDIIIWLVNHSDFREIPYNVDKIEVDFCGARRILD